MELLWSRTCSSLATRDRNVLLIYILVWHWITQKKNGVDLCWKNYIYMTFLLSSSFFPLQLIFIYILSFHTGPAIIYSERPSLGQWLAILQTVQRQPSPGNCEAVTDKSPPFPHLSAMMVLTATDVNPLLHSSSRYVFKRSKWFLALFSPRDPSASSPLLTPINPFV